MKKLIFLSILLILSATLLFSEDILWGSMYSDPDFRFGVDAAFEADGTARQVSLYPEIEMLLWKPVIGGFAFFDIGASAKGRFGLPVSSAADLSIGAGLTASLHLGFRGFNFTGSEYLSKIDLYAETGPKFDFIGGAGFDWVVNSGVNYFITDNITAGVFYSNWGGQNGGGISVSIKTGDKPEVKGMDFELPEFSDYALEPYLLQFYTLLYSANFAGGNYPDTYTLGKGAIRRVSSMKAADSAEYTVEQALLDAFDDGSLLWSLNYADDSEHYYYEYITDAEGEITIVYFSGDEGVVEYKAIDSGYQETSHISWVDLEAEKRNDVDVTVEAGKFSTMEYSYIDESGMKVDWWLSDEVPGRLVSYKMEDDSEIITSELIEITSGNKAELYK